jgi:hypothetical protein
MLQSGDPANTDSRTAYRLWSSDDRKNSPPSATSLVPMSSPALSSGSSAASFSIRSRPDSMDFFPPPAYSEALNRHVQLAVKDDDPAWVDIDTLFDIPDHKRSATKTTPPKYSRTKRGSRQKARLSLRSVASITVEEPISDQESPCPLRTRPSQSRVTLEVVRADDDVAEEHVDPDEVLDRLDSISQHLQAMIEEGRKALATPSPVIPLDGWEDESRMSGSDAPITGRKGSRIRTGARRRPRASGSS